MQLAISAVVGPFAKQRVPSISMSDHKLVTLLLILTRTLSPAVPLNVKQSTSPAPEMVPVRVSPNEIEIQPSAWGAPTSSGIGVSIATGGSVAGGISVNEGVGVISSVGVSDGTSVTSPCACARGVRNRPEPQNNKPIMTRIEKILFRHIAFIKSPPLQSFTISV